VSEEWFDPEPKSEYESEPELPGDPPSFSGDLDPDDDPSLENDPSPPPPNDNPPPPNDNPPPHDGDGSLLIPGAGAPLDEYADITIRFDLTVAETGAPLLVGDSGRLMPAARANILELVTIAVGVPLVGVKVGILLSTSRIDNLWLAIAASILSTILVLADRLVDADPDVMVNGIEGGAAVIGRTVDDSRDLVVGGLVYDDSDVVVDGAAVDNADEMAEVDG